MRRQIRLKITKELIEMFEVQINKNTTVVMNPFWLVEDREDLFTRQVSRVDEQAIITELCKDVPLHMSSQYRLIVPAIFSALDICGYNSLDRIFFWVLCIVDESSKNTNITSYENCAVAFFYKCVEEWGYCNVENGYMKLHLDKIGKKTPKKTRVSKKKVD
jgi:hypothetical protein